MSTAAVVAGTPAVVEPKALSEQELTAIFRARQAELQALVAVSITLPPSPSRRLYREYKADRVPLYTENIRAGIRRR